jgi:hypothetical protein
VTATRDRRSDPAEDAETAWDDRPILGTFRGLPWWGGVLLAFGLAAVAAVVDMQRQGSLGMIYQIAYGVGCVGAVCVVRRRSLFGPIVQPPLVFAVTAIGAVVALDENPGNGLRQLILSVAIPLTSNFPTMAAATVLTVAVGVYRLWKERDPNPPVRVDLQQDRPNRESGPPGEPGPTRRPRPGRDRVPPASRKGRDRDPEEPENRGTQRGRQPRTRGDAPSRERGTGRRDRDPGPPERGTGERPRGNRSRPRDQDPSPRRRDSDPRPRRDERPSPRRDPGDGDNPRQPRRRPQDPYR